MALLDTLLEPPDKCSADNDFFIHFVIVIVLITHHCATTATCRCKSCFIMVMVLLFGTPGCKDQILNELLVICVRFECTCGRDLFLANLGLLFTFHQVNGWTWGQAFCNPLLNMLWNTILRTNLAKGLCTTLRRQMLLIVETIFSCYQQLVLRLLFLLCRRSYCRSIMLLFFNYLS